MDDSERGDFGKAMARLFAIYNDDLTETMLEAWWGVLKGHPLREVVYGMNTHATDPQWGHRRPAVSDILRHITETLPAQRREIRNKRVREARARIEPLETELYRLEADLRVKVIKTEDIPAAEARMNGLRMQIGAMHREAGIDDSARIEHEAAAAFTLLTQHLPKKGHAP